MRMMAKTVTPEQCNQIESLTSAAGWVGISPLYDGYGEMSIASDSDWFAGYVYELEQWPNEDDIKVIISVAKSIPEDG
jgi:hypothetical protein